MSLADIASDTNSYYILQIIHEPAKNRHHVFRKWGRVGTSIGGSKIERMKKQEVYSDRAQPPPAAVSPPCAPAPRHPRQAGTSPPVARARRSTSSRGSS